jgi:hypothetical protein
VSPNVLYTRLQFDPLGVRVCNPHTQVLVIFFGIVVEDTKSPDLEPYSPNAVKKRKDISDGVMESWSVESSVWSPNPITPVFQYSLTPTFGSGYAGLGLIVGGFPAWAVTH